MSLASVGDVLDHDLNDGGGQFHNVSFQIWVKILKDDLDYTEADKITYHIDGGISRINSDRTFRAALRDAWARSKHAAFNVTRATSYSGRSRTHGM